MNWADANFLPWLIPIPPLIAFAVIILAAGRSKTLSHVIAIGAMTLSWIMGWSLVLHAIQFRDLGMVERGVFGSSLQWLVNGTTGNGALNMGVMVDPLTTVMMFMVPLACLMIFIYSVGYMAHDPRSPRFFAYLSLFASAMLTLVVADNLLLLFIGWEVMGLCSYLLIGFWYDRSPESQVDKVAPYQAGMKAFMTTRVADVILILGIAYLWASTGTLSFREIFFSESTLHMLAETPAVGGFLGLSAAGLIGICIVIGTIGKSAQFPLHVWLPDAMKGPTPVSAMIHAAAMVSAGVYLVIRMFPILSAGSEIEAGMLSAPMAFMAVVGGFSALFAATIAVGQNDIKKVLAYSTVSQLGFMVAVLGIGGFAAAAFHLITHALFKALLFMGSGSVIHGIEHGHHVAHAAHGAHDAHGDSHEAHAVHDAHGEHHDEDHEEIFDPQDMRNMGGLWRNMPVTTVTMIIGGMSLAGLPLLTAGFWSKDEILLEALYASSKTPVGLFVLIFLSLAAILTAFYTWRLLAMTFFGSPRTDAAVNASHYDPRRGDGPTERNISVYMTAPLIVLSFFAAVAGFVGVNPSFPVIGPLLESLGIKKPFIAFVQRTLLEPPHLPDFNLVAVLLSFTIFILGIGLGYWLYSRRPVVLGQPDPVEGIIGKDVYRVLVNKYYIDEFYTRFLVRPFQWFADRAVNVILDRGIIDGVLHAVAAVAERIGDVFKEFNRVVIDGVGDGIPEAIADAARGMRPVQSGRIQQYMLYALIAALVMGVNLAILAVFPQAVTALAIVQGVIAIGLVLFFGSSGSPRPGDQTSDQSGD
jgi:NADH-quinone oxidoreductase subunit L